MFVQRDENGAITGVYVNEQPGLAEEEIADDDPELVAFRARPVDPPRPLTADELWEALLAKGVVTAEDDPRLDKAR